MTRDHAIPFGYELGTGAPVAIPLNHMVVTGQTQMTGKTTTLEALIVRSGVRAIVFLTKRGEGAFGAARVIPPYFREQADWKYVSAILEASLHEKLKFERSWIMRAARGAKTLADVQANIRTQLKTAKGLNADVYTVLDTYLDDVVPQIQRTRWAPGIALEPGVNAMDLSGLTEEMQHLVIRSALEWVLTKEQHTVVVVPEAWKFIPQGRGTPVKLAAEAFIRQAAGLGNYLWLDSQDIAGVEKIILKSCPVWILGVQREANEVKRTLDQIPAGIKKPKPEQIATLGLGQFYVCHGTHITQSYAQPAWLPALSARQVAMGELTPREVAAIRAITDEPRAEEAPVDETEARALRDENAALKAQVGRLEATIAELQGSRAAGAPTAPAAPRARPRAVPGASTIIPWPTGDEAHHDEDMDRFDELYRAIRDRLKEEAPALLRVLTLKPELEVLVERSTVQIDGKSPRGRIARLLAEGFFREAKTAGQVQQELARRGKDPGPRITPDLNQLAEEEFLFVEEGRDAKSRVVKVYRSTDDVQARVAS